MKLQALPKLPSSVKYALTVPQSILFADLSLRGNTREFFKEALKINYEPKYIVIDAGGAMSWNYDTDNVFVKTLVQNRSVITGITQFIDSMGMTSRKLARRMYLGERILRRKGNTDDLIEDLQEYWHAYRLHMTSLFAFWNIQHLLSKELKQNDDYSELENNILPTETNQFKRERLYFEKIVKRFAPTTADLTSKSAPQTLINALNHHAREFAFLLSPFNLNAEISGATLLPRVIEFQKNKSLNSDIKKQEANPILVSPKTKDLLVLAQSLAYWKNERIDVLSLADAAVEPLYQQAADSLSMELNDLFFMSSDELLHSLKKKKHVVSSSILKQRKKAYCLALINGSVNFYIPSTKTQNTRTKQATKITIIHGIIASSGKVSGKVRLIRRQEDLAKLQKGEILVTKMTRPEFGAALDRAAAFVTDEGGMLCHAAIIAREMKKPCIIGAKITTQVLKDGDLVEVNANNGIIRFLDR